MQLILAVSLRRRRSLPKAAIHGLPLPLSVRSLSARASDMSARSGIPRSAATDLARRKIASGISSVVFMPCMFPYLWVTVNWLTFGRTGRVYEIKGGATECERPKSLQIDQRECNNAGQ